MIAPSKRKGLSSPKRKHRDRRRSTRNSKALQMIFLPEPMLEFGYGQQLVYPRDGLFLFGPSTKCEDLPGIRYGVIGTPEGVRRFREWASRLAHFIPIPPPKPRGRKIEPQHIPFPGFSEAFRSHFPAEPTFVIDDLQIQEIGNTLRIENRHEAIHDAVDLYVSRLIRENNRLENPPSFWFVVIPEVVYELGRPQSVVPKAERVSGQVAVSARRAQELKNNQLCLVLKMRMPMFTNTQPTSVASLKRGF